MKIALFLISLTLKCLILGTTFLKNTNCLQLLQVYSGCGQLMWSASGGLLLIPDNKHPYFSCLCTFYSLMPTSYFSIIILTLSQATQLMSQTQLGRRSCRVKIQIFFFSFVKFSFKGRGTCKNTIIFYFTFKFY